MNKLIPGALFSPRDAQEQRLRDAQREGQYPFHDVRNPSNSWDRVAEGFRKHDPAGRKLAELLTNESTL